MRSSWRYWVPLGIAGVVIAAIAIADQGGDGTIGQPAPLEAQPAVGTSPRERPAHTRWLAFGGGVEPSSNQVSIEQDIALIGELLGGDGVTLFAGGVGRSPVQVLNSTDRLDAAGGLHRRLGDLFFPQDGRDASYRDTTLQLHGDARAETVIAQLIDALEEPSRDPLVVFVAAHGEPGSHPNENLVRLWGGAPISVKDLAGILGDIPAPRPLRLVMATCFAGGFAELAFTDANPERGAVDRDVCGLFATTWDTEAAGCDPNPDRRAQESYFVHLLHALRGQDRHGRPAAVDLDGDGKVSLLEAHTWVRIASRSVSIPTTTSERWLREHMGLVPEVTSARVPELAEENSVIAALSSQLELSDGIATRARLLTLEGKAHALDIALDELSLELEVASADLRIALVERWPTLDDPYHTNYPATLEANGPAIRTVLDGSPPAAAYARAQASMQRASHALENLDVEMAMTRRLLRAHENVAAAARLRDDDAPAFARLLKFLRCERTIVEPTAR